MLPRGVGTLTGVVVYRAQRTLLRVWKHVPRTVRRWLVRLGAPSYTVGTACVIERDDGSILLVRLTYRDRWGLPGGLIERREDVAECARREVREEVDLAVDLVGAPAVVVDSHPQRIDVVFRARPAAGADPDAARPASPEIRDVRWFPAHDLPELQHETVSGLLALAATALGVPGAEDAGAVGAPGGPGGPGEADDGHRDLSPGTALRKAADQAAMQRAVTVR